MSRERTLAGPVHLRGKIDGAWKRLTLRRDEHCISLSDSAVLFRADVFRWLKEAPRESVHAVVTDPPYGVVEYEEDNHAKLRTGVGGVWRIPPSFDGAKRQPVPRFTVLTPRDLTALERFFTVLGSHLLNILVPGGHVFIASNPLLSSITFHCLQQAGFEKRGEVIRLTQTLRGGDRPKGAEKEFPEVSVMPRSAWEPWGVFRKPFSGTVAQNLRVWGTGGLRRVSMDEPFKDVVECSPTRTKEKELAPHPSLKPQRFLRKVVRAALPLGQGIVFDPFAGSGSTLAAAEALGYRSIGVERDPSYVEMARAAFPKLIQVRV